MTSYSLQNVQMEEEEQEAYYQEVYTVRWIKWIINTVISLVLIVVWYGFLELGFMLHRGDNIYLSAFLGGLKEMRKILEKGPWHIIQRQFPDSFLLFSFPSQGWSLCKTRCIGTQAQGLCFSQPAPSAYTWVCGERMWQLPTICPHRSHAS